MIAINLEPSVEKSGQGLSLLDRVAAGDRVEVDIDYSQGAKEAEKEISHLERVAALWGGIIGGGDPERTTFPSPGIIKTEDVVIELPGFLRISEFFTRTTTSLPQILKATIVAERTDLQVPA